LKLIVLKKLILNLILHYQVLLIHFPFKVFHIFTWNFKPSISLIMYTFRFTHIFNGNIRKCTLDAKVVNYQNARILICLKNGLSKG